MVVRSPESVRDRLSQTDSWVSGRDEVEELVAVLAHEGLHVVAGHVVPLDTVVVEVVQDGQAGLVVTLQMSKVIKPLIKLRLRLRKEDT